MAEECMDIGEPLPLAILRFEDAELTSNSSVEDDTKKPDDESLSQAGAQALVPQDQLSPREYFLELLRSRLKETKRIAIIGVGGAGESRLAYEFAHHLKIQSSNAFVFWVPATSVARLEQNFRSTAQLVELLIQPEARIRSTKHLKEWGREPPEDFLLIGVPINNTYPLDENHFPLSVSSSRSLYGDPTRFTPGSDKATVTTGDESHVQQLLKPTHKAAFDTKDLNDLVKDWVSNSSTRGNQQPLMIARNESGISENLVQQLMSKSQPGSRFVDDSGSHHSASRSSTHGHEETTLVDTDRGSTLIGAEELYFDNYEPDTVSEVDATGGSYASVMSNYDDIGSVIMRQRNELEIYAVHEIYSYLSHVQELRPLHEKAGRRFRGMRFQENYRRVFKDYAIALRSEARSTLAKDVAHLLYSRFNRIRIAHRIKESLSESDNTDRKSMDHLKQQCIDKERLEEWMSKQYEPLDPNEESTEPENTIEDDEDDGDSDEDFGIEELQFSNIDQAKELLRKGAAFETLQYDLKLLILPASIREVVESTSLCHIRVSKTNDWSSLNLIKLFIEMSTALEWDWWPLGDAVPTVLSDEAQLEWKVMGHTLYKVITSEDADLLQSTLEKPHHRPPRCFCHDTQNDVAEQKEITCSPNDKITKRGRSGILGRATSTSSEPSKAARAYIPPGRAGSLSTGSASSQNATHVSNTGNNNTSPQTQNCNQGGWPLSGQTSSLRIIFGIQNSGEFNAVESIDMPDSITDPDFFRQLNVLHAKHRWKVQRWFSPFRFRYCNFVQFETFSRDHVYCNGEALPDDHGHKDDYEYHPRPPTAKNPPIKKKLFAICLKACHTDCHWSWLPQFIHHCPPWDNTSPFWRRIPRKKTAFDALQCSAGDIAFGLQADYALSFAMVFIYVLVPVCSAFGFWAYWLKTHSGDLQNASVPFFALIALSGPIWLWFQQQWQQAQGQKE